MKQITKDTILKQQNKTFTAVEVDGIIYWIDEENKIKRGGCGITLGTSLIYTNVGGSDDDIKELNDNSFNKKIVAQSQYNLKGIPVIHLDSFINECKIAIKYWKNFKKQKYKDMATGIEFAIDYYKSDLNINRYSQNDIDNAITLFECGKSKPEIFEEINKIKEIEVDKNFNVIIK